MKLKTILIFIPSLEYGGAEKFVVTLINNLHGVYFNVDLLLGEKKGILLKDIPHDVNIFSLSSKSSKKNLFCLYRFLLKNQYEVALATLGACVSLSLVKKLLPYKIKICCRLGNTISTELKHAKKISYMSYFLQKVGCKLILSQSDVVVAQCEYMKTDINKYFKCKDNIKVIFNGVDTENIRTLSNQPCSLNVSKLNFVAVGAINYQKNHSLMIRAFHKACSNNPNAFLHIIGDGQLMTKAETLVINLGLENKVIFHGALANPYKILGSCDFFILSSLYEGFSNAILESLVLGVPVIATNSPGGNKEVINESNGIIAGDLTIDCLSEAICLAIKDQKKFIPDEIALSASARFCISNTTIQYSELINNLFNNNERLTDDKSIPT